MKDFPATPRLMTLERIQNEEKTTGMWLKNGLFKDDVCLILAQETIRNAGNSFHDLQAMSEWADDFNPFKAGSSARMISFRLYYPMWWFLKMVDPQTMAFNIFQY